MREGAEAIDGVHELLRVAGPGFWNGFARERQAIDATFARAARYLRENPDFESFNRLAFISVYAQRSALALDSLRRVANTTPVRIPRAWRVDAPSVYSASAFNPRVYAPSTAPASSRELVALGRRLFFDPSLSGTGTRSCSSCHNPALGFADGVVKAHSIDSKGSTVARNTPTLINAALQPAQFADERSATLEDQIVEVLRSPAEMSSSVEQAAATIGSNPSYALGVRRRVCGGRQSSAVTPLHATTGSRGVRAHARLARPRVSIWQCAAIRARSRWTNDAASPCSWAKAGAARATSRRCSAATRRRCTWGPTSR